MPKTEPDEREKLGAPSVPEALADIEGGDHNLIPFDPERQHVRVVFPLWKNSMPSEAFPEFVRIYLDGMPVAYKQWTAGPIADNDLFIDVAVETVVNVQGRRVLHYEAKNWSGDPGNPLQSETEVITIDTRPPRLASPDSRLQVPDEVSRPNQLTAYYLERNEDRLRVQVPRYDSPAPGDHIVWS